MRKKTKMYRVLVSWGSFGDMCIEAENEDAAKVRAAKLADWRRGEILKIDSDTPNASDAQEVERPDAEDKENALENAEAWKELEDEGEV